MKLCDAFYTFFFLPVLKNHLNKMMRLKNTRGNIQVRGGRNTSGDVNT